MMMKNSPGQYTKADSGEARHLPSTGLITRQQQPKNLETPADQLDSFLTPTELFYIRSHFPAPMVDVSSYQLRVDGAVRNPFSLNYEDLRAMPSETRVALLECAGNGRVYLAPASYGFCGVLTVPEGVLVADWGAASSRAAMHSTPAPSAHHWGPARLPAPGPGSTLGCAVHR